MANKSLIPYCYLFKRFISKMCVGVNDVEKMILENPLKNPALITNKISLIIEKSKRIIERYLKSL